MGITLKTSAFCASGLAMMVTLTAQTQKPNIILIVTDDMGVGDIATNPHADFIHTPNIDRLAANGVTFTQGYASAAMSLPSRVGLLTGRYPARVGAYKVNSLEGLPENTDIISDYLKRAGYTTGIFGKWHVGGEFIEWQRPENKSFDRTFYWFDSTHDYWEAHIGRTLTWGEVGYAPIYNQGKVIDKYETDYLTSDIGKQTLEFVEQNSDKPFFLYIPTHVPHVPLQAPKDIFDKYDVLGYDRNTTLVRAMYEVLDDYVGQLLDKLNQKGIRDNTIIVFTSDNGGGEPDGQLNNISRGGKFTMLEGGLRVPLLISWPKSLPQGFIYHHPTINLDILPTILGALGISPTSTMDGVNLMPFLKGEKKGAPHQTLYWSSGLKPKDDFAIRQGDWKLVSTHNGVGLFNLAKDPSELYDMTKEQTQIAKKLKSDYEQWDSFNIQQTFSQELLDKVKNAQDSVAKLGIKYNYSSTFNKED